MNTAHVEEKNLTTADVAAAAERPEAQREAKREVQERGPEGRQQAMSGADEQLAPLFTPNLAGEFRSRWDAVQISFVDDPKQAVKQADELVAQVMKSLAETFSGERTRFEGEMDRADGTSTETMRVALRRYRSFFQRLLSL